MRAQGSGQPYWLCMISDQTSKTIEVPWVLCYNQPKDVRTAQMDWRGDNVYGCYL